MIRKKSIEQISPYLKDASNYSGGMAEEVVIPENLDELIKVLKKTKLYSREHHVHPKHFQGIPILEPVLNIFF